MIFKGNIPIWLRDTIHNTLGLSLGKEEARQATATGHRIFRGLNFQHNIFTLGKGRGHSVVVIIPVDLTMWEATGLGRPQGYGGH